MMTSTNDTGATAPKVSPAEVAWDFVPQYYTYVNKQPSRLHCFYTKNSVFTHGAEGEDVTLCHGQQEIHNKILSIGFKDCKVFINSVDAQSSADGGIIIQVIGEMSNDGENSRKFVQTVFLAEQPNGYFVLNDIFRFLKEEYAGDEEYAEEQEESTNETVVAPTQDEPVANVVPPVVDAPAPEPEPPAAEPTPEVPKSNGIHVPTEPAPAPEPEKLAPPPSAPTEPPKSEEASPAAKPDTLPTAPSPSVSPAPPVEPEAPAPPPPTEPAPAPPTTAPPPTQQVPPPKPTVVAPTPSGPPVPKTWANLAAANSNKWGSQVAQEAKGVSTPPPPAARTATPPRSTGPSGAPREALQKDTRESPSAITTAQCFVKGVTANIPTFVLKEVLISRFGPIKELDIVPSRACAFLEFETVEAARKAITASLPINQGGEGGIRIEDSRITVEVRKERSERPPRTRGGGPNGDTRGGFRIGRGGRGGERGGRGGRGSPPPK